MYFCITARTLDILQIACVCGYAQCHVYTRPTCHISTGASVAAGLTYTGGVLKLNDGAVDSTTIADSLHKFLDFVLMFPNAVLIDHNIQSFDVPVLIHQLSKYNLVQRFNSSVIGFLDTLSCQKESTRKQRSVIIVKKILS